MAFDMREETLRHQAGWRGFAVFLGLSLLAIVVTLGLLALVLL